MPQELSAKDYLANSLAILQRWWWLIAILSVIGTVAGYGATYLYAKRYTSQTLVLVQQPTVPGDYVKPVISQDVGQRLTTMQQQILSRTRLEPVIQQFALFSKDAQKLPMEDLVNRIRSTITVTPIRANGASPNQPVQAFAVSVQFEDPHLAQQICSTITSMFMEENLKLRQELSEQTTQFIGGQLEEAKAKLDQQDAKLAAFERGHLGSLPDADQANLTIMAGLKSQLDAVNQTLGRANEDKNFTESLLAQQMQAWQASSELGQNPETLQQQLTAAELQLSTLESKYTDQHPDVIKAKSDIEALKKKIAETDNAKPTESKNPDKVVLEPAAIGNLRASIYQLSEMIKEKTAQQEKLEEQIKAYEARIESSPAIEQDYKELTRDFQAALTFYNELLAKRQQSAMATDLERKQEGEQFQVLDPANLPDKPSFPNVPLFVSGGTGAGLALSLAIIFLIEMLDSSLRSTEDVEHLIHLPVLAAIPVIEGIGAGTRRRSSVIDGWKRRRAEKLARTSA